MERLIAYDKLAREDRLVRMRAREVAQLKIDQGLPPFPDLLSRDSIKERIHGIMVGELQAMEDAAARVAGVNRGLEGLACDVFNQLVHIARKMGDPILERAVDYVLADEITHVRMGSKWLTRLTEGDPERRRRAVEFQETIDERFNLGGIRREGDHEAVPISIATEARREGGFTDEEIARLIKTTQRSAVY